MSRKRSDESRVLEFFREAPVTVAVAIFGLVKEEMKKRTGETKGKKAVVGKIASGVYRRGEDIKVDVDPVA